MSQLQNGSDETRFQSDVATKPEQVEILYVEDDPTFADLAVTCLENETDRFSITTATDATTGLQRLTDDIDCIVSDYNMPGMDGIEFLETVRETHPQIPFILFTGKGSEEVASEAISAGVTDYLQKEGGSDQFTVLANRITNAVERHRAQAKLDRQNERLDTVVENAPLILFALDSDGVFTFSEGKGLAEIGMEPGGVVGDSVFDVFAGDDDILAAAERALDGEQTTTRHEVAGSIFETTYNPVFDDDGTVRTVIGVATDITARAKREQAIEELHTTARALMEAKTVETIAEITVDAICDVLDMPGSAIHLYDGEDNELVPVAWSDQTEDLVGNPLTFEPGEGIAWTAYETGNEQIYEDVSTVSERYNPDTDVRSQLILPLGDHGVLLIGSPEANAFSEIDLDLARTLATHATTALNQADSKQALQESKERFQKIFEHSTDAIMVIDPEGETVVDANQAACEMLDYKRTELLSLSPTDIHPHEIDRFRNFVDTVQKEGTGWTDDLSCLTKAGDRIPAEVSASVIEFDDRQHVLAAIRDISERKKHKRKLERERERYAMLFKSLPNPVLHARAEDGEPVIQNVNAAFEKVFGYDAETLRGEQLHDYILPDDQIDEVDELNRRILDEDEVRTEVRRETTDGVRTFRLDINTRTDECQQTEGYAIYTDVTDREVYERELEAQRRRFRSLFEHLSQPTAELEYVDDDPIVRRVNDAFAETFGYDAGEIVGESLDDFIVPDDRREEASEINDRVQETGQLVSAEVTRQTASGRREFLLQNAVFDNGSKAFAIYTDITERVERERELEILRTAIDHAHIPLTLADPSQDDNPLVYVNDAFEEVTGYSQSEAIGNNCRFLQGEQTDPENVAVLRDAIENEEPATVELRNYRKDGTMFWNRVSIRPIYDENGELLRYYGSQQDITEEKESRQRIERQNERLDEFAGVISHDLRSPLRVAETRLELAAEGCNSDHLAAVADAHDRMDTLIQDLLTEARAGTRVDEMESVELESCVEQTWRTMETDGATLTVETDQTIQANPTRLKQLLENLVRNAIGHGGGDVHITVGECDQRRGFYVADDGPGIPEDDRENVFDSGYSTAVNGTGFGLAIVETVAHNHGWDIEVSESRDGGARFEISGVSVS